MGFRQVYEEHFRFVWRSLRRLGVPAAETPDAVQEVFLVVHRRLSEFEARSKMTTWLFAISLRVASSRRRLARLRREVPDDDVPEPVDIGTDVSASAERKQGMKVLEGMLDKLPLEQRAVFVAFELEGMTGEEIAEMVGAPVGTVHSRLRLARQAVRDMVASLHARDRFWLQAREG